MSWEVIYPIGAFLLLLGIAWGFWRSKRRSSREKAITEVATNEMYRRPDRYVAGTRNALDREAEKEKARAEAKKS
jgi:hypothetical protein